MKIFIKLGITPFVKYNDPLRDQKSLVNSTLPVIFDVGAFDGRTVDFCQNISISAVYTHLNLRNLHFANWKEKYKSDSTVRLYSQALAEEEEVHDLYINQSGLTILLLRTSSQGLNEFPKAIK
jgi:hypothetical protein